MDRVAEAKARMRLRKKERVKERRQKRVEKFKGLINKVGTLNIILFVVFGIFLWFNKQMIDIYKLTGSIPESYACAVVAALLGECGFCGWIKTSKHRLQDRKWTLEDRMKRYAMDNDFSGCSNMDSQESMKEEDDNGVVG